MGRVYEALKRAADNGAGTNEDVELREVTADEVAPRAASNGNGHNGHGDAPVLSVAPPSEASPFVAARGAVIEHEDLLGRTSNFFHAPGDAAAAALPTAYDSASIEHTGHAVAGSALSGERASRVAGATVDAVGSARADVFPSVEISSARVEPHLVAITDPRSSHAEQYRSLRTRVLHAGERRKLQALVITSAGPMEGKTITGLNLAWLLAQTDGVRAIFVDSDLRNPCAADYLGIETGAGPTPSSSSNRQGCICCPAVRPATRWRRFCRGRGSAPCSRNCDACSTTSSLMRRRSVSSRMPPC